MQLFMLCVSMLKYSNSFLESQCSRGGAGQGRSSSVGTSAAWLSVHDLCQAIVAVVNAVMGSQQALMMTATPPESSCVLIVLPWLMLLGRVLLQWVQLLQQQLECVQAGGQQGPGAVNCNSRAADDHATTLAAIQYFSRMQMFRQLPVVLETCVSWVQQAEVRKQLTGAGYEPKTLLQQLQAAGTTVGRFPPVDIGEHSSSAAADSFRSHSQQLEQAGRYLTALPTPCACNNPDCADVSNNSEQQLVNGKSCICGGCKVARFCSRKCQKAHWKAHRPVCKALAAAAAAAAQAEAAVAAAEAVAAA
jgi:hypothetical protein